VNQFDRYDGHAPAPDPGRLARPVKQFPRLAIELLHRPGEPAGVAEGRGPVV
jgi:hypothetical protein